MMSLNPSLTEPAVREGKICARCGLVPASGTEPCPVLHYGKKMLHVFYVPARAEYQHGVSPAEEDRREREAEREGDSPMHELEIQQAQQLADDTQEPYWVIKRYDKTQAEVVWECDVEGDPPTICVCEPRYRTLDDIKERNRRLGQSWFSPDTMRFFSSRVQERIYPTADGGAYFVSSERAPHGDARRLYTVRFAHPDGAVTTCYDFQGYKTGRAAHAAARRLAEGGE